MPVYFEKAQTKEFIEIKGGSQILTEKVMAHRFGEIDKVVFFIDPNPETTNPKAQIEGERDWGWEMPQALPLKRSFHGGIILERKDLPVRLTFQAGQTGPKVTFGKIVCKD